MLAYWLGCLHLSRKQELELGRYKARQAAKGLRNPTTNRKLKRQVGNIFVW